MKSEDMEKELSNLKKEFGVMKAEHRKMAEKNEIMEKELAQQYDNKVEKIEYEMEELKNICQRLEREIKGLRKGEDTAGAQKTCTEITVGELMSVLPEFSPDNRAGAKVKEWTEAVERLRNCYNVKDRVLLAAVRAKWTGSTQQWLQFRQKDDMSWDSLKKDLMEDFNIKKSTFQVMNAVSRTVRRAGQSLVNYFLEMTALAEGVMEEEDIVRAIMNNSEHPILRHEMTERVWAREKVTKDELWKRMVYLDEQEKVEGGERRKMGKEREVAPLSCMSYIV